jgi:hypothetical protein
MDNTSRFMENISHGKHKLAIFFSFLLYYIVHRSHMRSISFPIEPSFSKHWYEIIKTISSKYPTNIHWLLIIHYWLSIGQYPLVINYSKKIKQTSVLCNIFFIDSYIIYIPTPIFSYFPIFWRKNRVYKRTICSHIFHWSYGHNFELVHVKCFTCNDTSIFYYIPYSTQKKIFNLILSKY